MTLDILIYLNKLKTRSLDQNIQVWDRIRKNWVAFTPEEMVRQLFVQYLVEEEGISIGRIAIEKVIKLAKRTKRCDILIYDSNQQVEMIIECKSPEVVLNDDVIAQVVRYNQTIGSKQLGIVNGIEYIIFEKDKNNHWKKIE